LYFEGHPEEHPGYMAMDRPPAILLPYHPDASKCRLADNMQNMTLPHGRVVCDLMSTVGISKETLFKLCSHSLLCAGCSCWYSIEGYHQHRALGPAGYVCTGSEDLPSSKSLPFCTLSSQITCLRLQYPVGIHPWRTFLSSSFASTHPAFLSPPE
jgi:hypothetical protein